MTVFLLASANEKEQVNVRGFGQEKEEESSEAAQISQHEWGPCCFLSRKVPCLCHPLSLERYSLVTDQ